MKRVKVLYIMMATIVVFSTFVYSMESKNPNDQLRVAAQIGNLKGITAAVKNGADVNFKHPHGVGTALHVVAVTGNVKCFKKFIMLSGVDVNATDGEENTPLHRAAFSGNIECIRILLECGSDIKAKNKNGNTPLHIASSRGNVVAVQCLISGWLEKGKNLDELLSLKNKNNQTPLQIALESVKNSNNEKKIKKFNGIITWLKFGAQYTKSEKKAIQMQQAKIGRRQSQRRKRAMSTGDSQPVSQSKHPKYKLSSIQEEEEEKEEKEKKKKSFWRNTFSGFKF